MPILDEAARLLRASTGIALVHEPALVVHETVKIPTGAGQTLTEILGGHFQDFATNGIGGTEDFAKRKNQSLFAI